MATLDDPQFMGTTFAVGSPVLQEFMFMLDCLHLMIYIQWQYKEWVALYVER